MPDLCAWKGCESAVHPLTILRRAIGGVGLCHEHELALELKMSARATLAANMRARPGTVYAALIDRCSGLDGQFIKIGVSTCASERVRDLKAVEWEPVWSGENEGEIQIRFWDDHSHGEFFHRRGEVDAWYQTLRDQPVAVWRGHALVANVGAATRPACLDRVRSRGQGDVARRGDITCTRCSKEILNTAPSLIRGGILALRAARV